MVTQIRLPLLAQYCWKSEQLSVPVEETLCTVVFSSDTLGRNSHF